MMDATRRVLTFTLMLPLLGILAACGPAADDQPAQAWGGSPEQEQFWANLQQLCGNAYEGRLVEAPEADTTFVDRRLVMHVRGCESNRLQIPFHVGENRSRTWILTLVEDGIELKHDHRHEDGTDDDVTFYGGTTAAAGTAQRQEFPADEFTAALIPAAATNVWTVEILPGETFAYAVRREGTDRRIRVEFDLTDPVAPPPAPWGWD
jgi:hypothetical protein